MISCWVPPWTQPIFWLFSMAGQSFSVVDGSKSDSSPQPLDRNAKGKIARHGQAEQHRRENKRILRLT